jgi:hypothetical protein
MNHQFLWYALVDNTLPLEQGDLLDTNSITKLLNLKQILSAPLAIVKRIADKQAKRIRLLPPYREHLTQAFARQFMRVGLPIDLPKEYPFSNS